MKTTIYQWSNHPFEKIVDGLSVKRVPVFHLPAKKRRQAIFQAVSAEIDMDKDILIFGTDHVSVPTRIIPGIFRSSMALAGICL